MEALRKNRLARTIVCCFAGLLVLVAVCGVVLSVAEGTSEFKSIISKKLSQ